MQGNGHEFNFNNDSKQASLNQIPLSNKNISIDSPYHVNGGHEFSQTPQNSQHQNGNPKETMNHEYLKNVILKYFIYSEGKHYNEASMLMTAIMTILKMSKEDREKINEARENATLWNSTKTFISNTFSFGGGSPQVNYQNN